MAKMLEKLQMQVPSDFVEDSSDPASNIPIEESKQE